MEPIIIAIQPYDDDDTTIYLTNSEDVAKEATKNIWVPIMPLKETIYNGGDVRVTFDRPLWLYTKVDGDYIDDYMEAFSALKNMGLYNKYGIHTYNIDFVLDEDRDYYIERLAYFETH
jgi:hypothetical protein